jgi:hypothetical protein
VASTVLLVSLHWELGSPGGVLGSDWVHGLKLSHVPLLPADGDFSPAPFLPSHTLLKMTT